MCQQALGPVQYIINNNVLRIFVCREFELPWVDMESREFKDRHKTPRSKTKSSGHRSSVSSQGQST